MFQEKPDVFNALSIYREMGMKIRRLEKFENALKYFDNALQRVPENIRALRGRATCRAQACKHLEALKDIKKMIEIEPNNIYVLALQCLVEYLCCDFERALIDNFNKILLRKKPDSFVMGVMHCEDAIRNCVGKRSGHPLRDHFKIIRKLTWINNYEKSKPFQPKTKYRMKKKKNTSDEKLEKIVSPKAKLPKPFSSERKKNKENRKSQSSLHSVGSYRKIGSEAAEHILSEGSSIKDSLHSTKISSLHIPEIKCYPFKPIQRYASNIQNLMSERYLDKMYQDREFLKIVEKNPGIKCPNTEGTVEILNLVKKSFKYINYNQEILRARRPFFLLRYQDCKSGGKLRQRQLERERAMTTYCERLAQNMLEKIKNAVSFGNLRLIIEIAEKMYSFCENTPKKTLPNRNNYLHQLFELVRDGFYNMKSIRGSMSEEQQLARISIILGLPKGKQSSTDSLITQFKDFFIDIKKQCQIIEKRVRASINREELVWLYHELSRLYFDLKKYELSKVYAIKCLKESYFLKDNKSIVNAMFLMIKVHVVVRNKNGAKIALKSCRNISKRIEDEKLDEFIGRCINVLNETRIDGTRPEKIIDIRMQRIVQNMPSVTLKNRARLIFQRMAALPSSKKMSVLPGVEHPILLKQGINQERKRKYPAESFPHTQEGKRIETNKRGIHFIEVIQKFEFD